MLMQDSAKIVELGWMEIEILLAQSAIALSGFWRRAFLEESATHAHSLPPDGQ